MTAWGGGEFADVADGREGGDDAVHVEVLGGGREVGRSCVYVRSGARSVLFDCGLHPARHGEARLPPKLGALVSGRGDYARPPDAVVITHCHLDHVGALPYLTEVLGYRGPVFMSEPTRALTALVLGDFLRRRRGHAARAAPRARAEADDADYEPGVEASSIVAGGGPPDSAAPTNADAPLYTPEQLEACLRRVRVLEVGGGCPVLPDLTLTARAAGHVLGAVMVQATIGRRVVLYSGDVAAAAEQHLPAADASRLARPDVLFAEGTYAGRVREDSRESRERSLLVDVHRTLVRGGHVLLPTFAVGRAQECLVLLCRYWRRHSLSFPVYVSSLAALRANEVYAGVHERWFCDDLQTSPSAEAEFAQQLREFVQPLTDRSLVDAPDAPPMVLLAAPAMLNGGFSRYVFSRWCEDERHLVALSGYCDPGTLAHGGGGDGDARGAGAAQRRVRCTVRSYNFSAHTDARGVLQLARRTRARSVVLVHGASTPAMNQLQQLLQRDLGVRAFVPRNGQPFSVELTHAQHTASPPRADALVDDATAASEERDADVQRWINSYRSGHGVWAPDGASGAYNATVPLAQGDAVAMALQRAKSELLRRASELGVNEDMVQLRSAEGASSTTDAAKLFVSGRTLRVAYDSAHWHVRCAADDTPLARVALAALTDER